MCGIVLLASGVRPCCADEALLERLGCPAGQEAARPSDPTLLTKERFYEGLTARGPDRLGSCTIDTGTGAELTVLGSVLQLRGVDAVSTPLRTEDGSVLVFNGEVFGGLEVKEGENDTGALMQELCCTCDVPELLSGLQGPWALVFWQRLVGLARPQAAKGLLWFGRDGMGRRSLLVHWPDRVDARFMLSSFSPVAETDVNLRGVWSELPPGLYSVKMSTGTLSHYPWTENHPLGDAVAYQRLPDRLGPTPEYTAAGLIKTDKHPKDASYGTEAHSASVSGQGVYQWPAGKQRHADAVPYTLCLDKLHAASMEILEHLRAAVHVRCQTDGSWEHHLSPWPGLGAPPPREAEAEPASPPATVALLFSGGVDSTLLAALAHEAIPANEPIDLINVCFDDGRSPDRLAALDALQELSAMAPQRLWRLIEVNSTLEEVDAVKPHLLSLLEPAGTVMDINIGAALWMASRGVGHPVLSSSVESQGVQPTPHAVRSAARVLLLGHGADEQCAGYGRHQTRFLASGWQGLQEELALDIKRLWVRNLGRDDRLVVSNCGREARHPFLGEAFMRAVLRQPLCVVANLNLPRGTGDKQLLRRALAHLQMPRASARVKRAIQFGSRIGKKANQRDFGSNRKANLQNAGSVKLRDIGKAESAPRP